MIEDIVKSDLKTILHSKRANLYYLEKCRIMQKDGRIVYLTETKKELVLEYSDCQHNSNSFGQRYFCDTGGNAAAQRRRCTCWFLRWWGYTVICRYGGGVAESAK